MNPLLPIAIWAALAWAAARASTLTVLESDGRGLSLEWTADGAEEHVAVVALPADARPALSWRVIEAAEIPPAAVDAPPSPTPADLSEPRQFRDLAVARLGLSSRCLRDGMPVKARRLFVRIDYRRDGSARGIFPAPAEHPTERFLQGLVLNYAASRGFRSGMQGPAPKTTAAALPPVRLVLRTRHEKIHVLTHADLRSAGVPVGELDPRRLRLYHAGRERPIYVGGQEDGRFDKHDYIEFIGARAGGEHTYHSLFSAWAVCYLVWDLPGMGLRAPAVPVAVRAGGTVAGEFPPGETARPHGVKLRLEEDNLILRIGSTNPEDIQDLGNHAAADELGDFWYWRRLGNRDIAEIRFNLPFHPAAAPLQGASDRDRLRVAIGLKGVTNHLRADPDHHLKFILNGTDISLVDGVANDALWEGQESYEWRSRPLKPGILAAGENSLVIQKVNDLRTTEGEPVENQDALLNYIELEFPAAYRVHRDELLFSNRFADSLGRRYFSVEGLTGDKVSLWDAAGRKLVGFDLFPSGKDLVLSFKDSLVAATDYLLAAEDKRLTPRMALDTLDDLLSGDNAADYIVLTHKSLLGPALDSLVNQRKSGSLRCRVVLVEHVYQTFGDGMPGPAPIRRFVEYAYRRWKRPAPAYLVLVGDASMWFDKLEDPAHPHLVPSSVVNIRGWGVASSDDYFVKVSGTDDLADLFVGRLPAADREDLSRMVHKILLHENHRPAGHWRNKTLLLGGFEEGFTAWNDRLQSMLIEQGGQFSRRDLHTESPYYRPPQASPGFPAQMDSAFNIVNFFGHGGGAIWSDGGLLTIEALDQGGLKGDFPVPLVTSVTCLTGYFEDVHARSLGEELIRLPRAGAAAFYGASGYISNVAGEMLSLELLRAARGKSRSTAGWIVHQAETLVALQSGERFLPILAEFNLLGDPALRLDFPRPGPPLKLQPLARSGGGRLSVSAADLPLAEAEGRMEVFLGDSLLRLADVAVRDGRFEREETVPAEPGHPRGRVVLHYWNGTESYVSQGEFSTVDWLIDSAFTLPADPRVGDSVLVGFRLRTPFGRLRLAGGIALFGVGGGEGFPFPAGNQVPVELLEDGRTVRSSRRVQLASAGPFGGEPHLALAFRLALQAVNEEGAVLKDLGEIQSRRFSLALTLPPDPALPAAAIRLPFQEDLGVWVRFENRGLGPDSGFAVELTREARRNGPKADSLFFPGTLAPGGNDSLFFGLGETDLGGRLIARILPRRSEIDAANNARDTLFSWRSRKLAPGGDPLDFNHGQFIFRLDERAGDSLRIFVLPRPMPSLPPHLEAPDDSTREFEVRFREGAPVAWVRQGYHARGAAAGKNPLPAWHYRPDSASAWLKLDGVDPGRDTGSISARHFRGGRYAPLRNRDDAPPAVEVTSRGQRLLPDDYVPLRTPIEITLRDNAGIDGLLHPPSLEAARQNLDSSNSRLESGFGAAGLVRLSFVPDPSVRRDSVFITAWDISGNRATHAFAYRLGSELSIVNLGSHPNPFADTAIFVYTLTEYCERVSLKVYSRSGRLVRSFEDRNAIGYREISWDGRTTGGHRIANGLYYLKITAEAGGEETSRIYKLFKKERR